MMKIRILINWDVEVVAHSEMVQKTSILSKDFNEDIFGQKFLQFTHKWKLLYHMWISQKSQKVKISESIYGMSSYWDEFLRLKMGSLGVLDVFCTVFECATTSRSNLKYCQFSWFSIFLFVGFDHSTIEMSTIFHLWVPNFFFQKVSS